MANNYLNRYQHDYVIEVNFLEDPIKFNFICKGSPFLDNHNCYIKVKELVMDLRFFKYSNNSFGVCHRVSNGNASFMVIFSKNQLMVLIYKRFPVLITCINLQMRYVIQPYSVGKEKRSIAMVIPAEIVKSLNIDPRSIFLILKIRGENDLQLQIIRDSDLSKKETGMDTSAEKVSEACPANAISIRKLED